MMIKASVIIVTGFNDMSSLVHQNSISYNTKLQITPMGRLDPFISEELEFTQ
jgi:hypothetical protein